MNPKPTACKIEFDLDNSGIYLKFREGKVKQTIKIGDGNPIVLADINEDNKLLYLEIFAAHDDYHTCKLTIKI